jgi:hypothetical protein
VHGTGRLVTFPDGWRVLKTIVRERLAPAPSAIGQRPDQATSLALPPFGG